MYAQEKVKPYDSAGEKRQQVERMFDNIAPAYDTLNHRMSWGIDRSWRRKTLEALTRQLRKGASSAVVRCEDAVLLDVATGTGDFAIELAKALSPKHLFAVDISEGMMCIGREKVERAGLSGVITFRREDSLQMSFDTATFDAATVAFGIRNFSDLDCGLREICRTLKPGGCLAIVELSTPTHFPMRQLFRIYSHIVLPLYGRIVAKDIKAYRYLTASIEAFPQAEQMKDILSEAGFAAVEYKRMTFGICTRYVATK